MPSGYERLDNSGADHKDEHGIPLYPLRDAEPGAPAPSAPAHETHVHVTVAAPHPQPQPQPQLQPQPLVVAAGGAGGQLYYGESHGLYQPISHNEVVERSGAASAAAPAIAIGAPAPAVTGMVSAPGAGAGAGSNLFPAQAYATAYGAGQFPPQAVPAPLAAVAYPQLPPPLPMPPSPAHVLGGMHHAGQSLVVAVPLPPPQQQPLVSVVPPVPQTYPQLKAMLDSRFVAFDTGRYLREGWAFTRQNLCTFVLALLLWTVIGVGVYVGAYFLFVKAGWEHQCRMDWDDEDGSNTTGYYDGCGHGFPWGRIIRDMLFEVLFAAPVSAGFIVMLFEAIRDNAFVKFRSTCAAFTCPYMLRLVGLTLLVSILTRLLTLLFVVPGIYFAIVTAFALPLHLQFRHIPLRAGHAIALSIKTLHRNCCSFFGFVLACVLINVLGMLCFGVGLLLTVPMTMAAGAYCYHHLVGVNGAAVIVPMDTAMAYQQQMAQMQAPPPPPPPQQQQQQHVLPPAVLMQPLQAAQPVVPGAQQPQVVVVVSPHNGQAPRYN